MKYLIAGLGNIGNEYENTRHNIGFNILDSFAKQAGFFFKDKRHAFIARHKYKARLLVLIKPTTYVNLSGKAVNYWMSKENILLDKLLIIVDDISLPFGTLRLKRGGGGGGHNGLHHIIETLGNQQFARLRFGIGNEFEQGRQVEYVLSKWTEQEFEMLTERINSAINIIKSVTTVGIEQTMNQFNNK